MDSPIISGTLGGVNSFAALIRAIFYSIGILFAISSAIPLAFLRR
jgi:hypothetical protein